MAGDQTARGDAFRAQIPRGGAAHIVRGNLEEAVQIPFGEPDAAGQKLGVSGHPGIAAHALPSKFEVGDEIQAGAVHLLSRRWKFTGDAYPGAEDILDGIHRGARLGEPSQEQEPIPEGEEIFR